MEEQLITIATDHYTSAEVLKARLESAGIPCFLSNVNLLQGAVSEGVKVQIKESDVKKAMHLMLSLKAEQEELEKKDLKAIRRILVPVDFTPHSKNAALYALYLAQNLNADIKLLHVYYAPIIDLVPITDAYSIQIDMDINLREMEKSARKSMLEFVDDIKKTALDKGFGGVRIAYSLREGIIEDEVAAMAITYKPGIIVAGMHSKGDSQNELIGSVLRRIIDKSKVPLLAIPEESIFSEESKVKNIVYATDFDERDYLAIRRLMQIVEGFKVKIFCVHVSQQTPVEWNKVKMENLKDYFKKVSKGIKVEGDFLEGENPVELLAKYITDNKIDIIALSSRKRNIFSRLFNPGLTRKLLHHSHVPLLIFRS